MVFLILLVIALAYLDYKLFNIGEKLTFEQAYERAEKKDLKYCKRHPGCSPALANLNRSIVMKKYAKCR